MLKELRVLQDVPGVNGVRIEDQTAYVDLRVRCRAELVALYGPSVLEATPKADRQVREFGVRLIVAHMESLGMIVMVIDAPEGEEKEIHAFEPEEVGDHLCSV